MWVQTFFKSAGLQKYFTVLYDDEDQVNESNIERQQKGSAVQVQSGRDSEDVTGATIMTGTEDVTTILTDWDKQKERHKGHWKWRTPRLQRPIILYGSRRPAGQNI